MSVSTSQCVLCGITLVKNWGNVCSHCMAAEKGYYRAVHPHDGWSESVVELVESMDACQGPSDDEMKTELQSMLADLR